MCRWLAYSGAPLALEDLLFDTDVSLIHQSFSARQSRTPINGDGFGVGWYGAQPQPGLYRDLRPAWNDDNLKDLAAHIESRMFLAHVRAATGSSVQRTNCHPFRHGKWLFVHNGVIHHYGKLRRELLFSVEPHLFPQVHGTTDSELMFHLALGAGLESRPIEALEEMAGMIERVGRAANVHEGIELTAGLSDGERLYAVRYSTTQLPPTLFHSRSIAALRELSPDSERLADMSDDARAIVSEPLSEFTDLWIEIPPSSALVVEGGEIRPRRFKPRR